MNRALIVQALVSATLALPLSAQTNFERNLTFFSVPVSQILWTLRIAEKALQ